MKPITTINPDLAKLPFFKFKAWHKATLPNDDMTAEERYKSIGGKVPAPVKDKNQGAK